MNGGKALFYKEAQVLQRQDVFGATKQEKNTRQQEG